MTDQPASQKPREAKTMTPLQKVAMGLIIVALDTLGTVDLLPDFLGWAMVLWGLAAIGLKERGTLLGSAAVCGVVALALWPPQSREALADAELALKWATSLPDLLFILLIARALGSAARDSGDAKFAGRFGLTMWATLVVTALPPVADAADSEALLGYADVAFVLLWLWLIWNLFAAHARPYAAAQKT